MLFSLHILHCYHNCGLGAQGEQQVHCTRSVSITWVVVIIVHCRKCSCMKYKDLRRQKVWIGVFDVLQEVGEPRISLVFHFYQFPFYVVHSPWVAGWNQTVVCWRTTAKTYRKIHLHHFSRYSCPVTCSSKYLVHYLPDLMRLIYCK